MFEKEAEEWVKNNNYPYSNCPNIEKKLKQTYKDGAEFGYNKKCEETFEMALSQIKHDRAVVIEENERLHAKNADLEAQIEKMKCCQNCLHYRHFTSDISECAMSFVTSQDCRHKDFYKWESKEKGEIKNEV